jgi:alginate O-acetyltransferase complex protein AlgI
MNFTQPIFLPFLLVVLVVANLLLKDRRKARLLFLTVASYFFYATWDWKLSGLILLSTFVDYFLGLQIAGAKTRSRAKLFVTLSVVFNLTLLGFFKYFNFFLDNVNWLFGQHASHWNIILPAGISFYLFQTMSYTIDLYRKRIKVEKGFLEFAFFVSFFPQLVAGPIVRAKEFLFQAHKEARVTREKIEEGVQIFLQGVVKKVLVANSLAIFVDAVFANPGIFSSGTLWLAVVAYAIQIFCDFSGYSDMAIGIARMLGYDLVLNFDLPYLSTSVTEFWRRWHISLSRWIRDYIYIPLGGNRKGKARQYVNLLITMFLGGLWHGASWNFVIWGGLHGVALAVEKIIGFPEWVQRRFLRPVGWALTMLFVLVTWVFFRARSFDTAFLILRRMSIDWSPGIVWPYAYLLLFIPLIVIAHWWGAKLRREGKEYFFLNLESYWGWVALFAAIIIILVLNVGNPQPFIYFQF